MKRALAAVALACALAVAGCGGHTTKTQTAKLTPAPTVATPGGQAAMGSVAPKGWGSTPPGFIAPQTLTAVPTAEGFDTVTLSTLSGLHPFALGGYTSGSWPTYLPLRAAYPTAHTLSVAVNASHHADCLDIEPGDAVPSQAGLWAKADIAAGFPHPCEYGDLSEMPAIETSLAATFGPAWHALNYLWLAWYRNIPGLVAGYDIVQWTDHAYGRNLDEDTFSLAALTIAQPPYVAPKPPPPPPAMNYNWFVTSPVPERQTVISYDGARKNVVKYKTYLNDTLRPELLGLADRLVYLAEHVHGTVKHPNYNWDHAGGRVQELLHRAQGDSCSSWAKCL